MNHADDRLGYGKQLTIHTQFTPVIHGGCTSPANLQAGLVQLGAVLVEVLRGN